MGAAHDTIYLPAPARGGWRLMLVVGLAVVGLGGILAFGSITAATPLPSGRSLIVLGIGLFLGSIAMLMLYTREGAASIEVHLDEGTLRLLDDTGNSVDIAAASLLNAITPANPNGNSGHIIALQKRDGGVIELAVVGSAEEATELASPLSAAITRLQQEHPERGAGWGAKAAANAAVPDIAGVSSSRDGGGLSLRWPAGSPLRSLIGAGCPAGMGLIFMGAGVDDGGTLILLAAGFLFGLAVIIAAAVLINQAVTCHVRVADGKVVVDRLRFSRVIQHQEIPLAEVVAVDYGHQLNATGAALSLRREKLSGALDALSGADDAGATFSAALQLMKGMGAGIQVPCGRLSLASKIALDMALSEAVARGSSRMPSEV